MFRPELDNAAEPAIGERESRYRDVVARMPAAVWMARMNGEILFANEQIETITGFTPAEFVAGGAELWARHVHPADIGALFDKWNEVSLRGQGSLESEYRFLRKDGKWVWLQQRISMIVEENRESYIVGISTDVTARRSAEEALRSSELRYRTLVEQANDIVFAIDPEGRIQSLNAAFETLTGYGREEWIGRKFVEMFEPASGAMAMERFGAVLAGDRTRSTEFRLRTKSGHLLAIEASADRVESDGQLISSVGIARDITQRKQTDAETARASRLASVGQLATSVAHEFNNVLMSIMPFAELLQRRYSGDERAASATTHILDAVRRGREISQKFLRFARPAKPEVGLVNVAAWLEEFDAEAVVGPSCRVERRIASDRSLAIRADRTLLDQVVTNLLTNAREAMPNGGKVTISARRSRQHHTIDIEVEDSGGGMSASVMQYAFEPLFTTKHNGSGLGLTIARQAMKQQEGAISVESAVGAGSTFTLSFPEANAAPVAAAEERPSRRLLIVDDDEAVGEGLRILLDDEGFDVRVATSGAEAVTMASTFLPHLVVLDLNLPDLSALEVYEQIRRTSTDVGVIFSTGHTDLRALEEVRQLDVPSIMKPYDVHELLAVIDGVAERR